MTESILCQDEGHGASGLPLDEEGICPIGRQYVALGQRFGFDHVLVSTFPKADKPEFAANILFCNWPAELRERYRLEDQFSASLLVQRLKQSIVPFQASECVFVDGRDRDAQRSLAGAFEDRGMSSSLAYAVHDCSLAHYLFVFSGQRAALERSEIADLYLESVELLDNCSSLIAQKDGPREKLSAREIECLRWSAAGKSSDEIAIILSISSHTVVSYLKSAMRKLDSVNRMQAVARACRFRLL
ncbi:MULTISPECIES: helix-turn-helix transcriptional regulator [Alphaproteobacteria]|uniref:LuxR family transcriptional regulator n=2 Tax=Alphaproteobacteria TaxID=28211 RepID=A0A512HJJ2_9HYPH|nr:MULTISPECIES: LuxR family transcriptional regulator [Alphaproteobacteria]GEO85619.1 LuxR family transcriptional regulator [Ciceribacter naphthalenivorans]GLR22026.1 LuxR family transcriptional regulator [Ciceribacter naphthalenivorans]GLT04882.1 LuxR family transcriptional regulator [Sphingomonas psychrolutea]